LSGQATWTFDEMLTEHQTALEQTLRLTVKSLVEARVKKVADAMTAQRLAEVDTMAKDRDAWAERAYDLEACNAELDRRNEELCGQFSALLESLRQNLSRGEEVLRVSEIVLTRCRRRSRSRSPPGRTRGLAVKKKRLAPSCKHNVCFFN
jgi:FtsZ-binding cell division protein ZapB